jgi:hypothetical protein
MRLIALLKERLRAEEGFTMVVAIGAMVLVLLMSVAAYTALQSDLGLTSHDSLQKQAYSAAQAGIQSYLFDLDSNSEYWTQCVPSPANGINQKGSTANQEPVPGSSNEKYAIELLPATGYTQCATNNPVNSMITTTGTGAGALRIRSTGYASGYNGGGPTTVSRTIVATLREESFLDYVWFTVYETSDPVVQVANAYATYDDTTIEPPYQCTLTPSTNCGSNYNNAITGATKQCGQYRYPPPGGTSTTQAVGYNRLTTAYAVPGQVGVFYQGAGHTYQCDTISFISADSINGPFHTNDQANVCGTPTFGRNTGDDIVFGYTTSSPPASPYPGGYVQQCTGPVNMKGTPGLPSILNPPPSNATLQAVATESYTGTTCLILGDTSIQVAQPGQGANASKPSCFSAGLTYSTVSYPSNGVLYVANGTCGLTYDVENVSYTGNTGCGTIYVSGVDGEPLTIGAEDDIVIDGNLTYYTPPSGVEPLLGLVANNFVRVYHPVGNQPLGTNTNPCTSASSNVNTSISSGITINAMMLSLQHSIIVDQYNCGAPLGTLTVNGGLAQDFRGAVGTETGNGTVVTGYAKNYNYDDRLRYEEPPHFINPVQGSWRVQSEEECYITASNGSC